MGVKVFFKKMLWLLKGKIEFADSKQPYIEAFWKTHSNPNPYHLPEHLLASYNSPPTISPNPNPIQ